MRFTTLTRMADQLMAYKYVARNVAKRAGKTVTFMPKPVFGDNGSGMHCHQSLWKERQDADGGRRRATPGSRRPPAPTWAGCSRTRPALLAFAAPTTNSYRRLVPGYEAPVNLVYSQRNRSACVRDPRLLVLAQGQADRVPLPRPDGQPLSRVPGDAAGRPRRDREGARPRRARRLRPVRGRRRRRATGAGIARRDARRRSRPTTTSCSRGASSARA